MLEMVFNHTILIFLLQKIEGLKETTSVSFFNFCIYYILSLKFTLLSSESF